MHSHMGVLSNILISGKRNVIDLDITAKVGITLSIAIQRLAFMCWISCIVPVTWNPLFMIYMNRIELIF